MWVRTITCDWYIDVESPKTRTYYRRRFQQLRVLPFYFAWKFTKNWIIDFPYYYILKYCFPKIHEKKIIKCMEKYVSKTIEKKIMNKIYIGEDIIKDHISNIKHLQECINLKKFEHPKHSWKDMQKHRVGRIIKFWYDGEYFDCKYNKDTNKFNYKNLEEILNIIITFKEKKAYRLLFEKHKDFNI